MQLQMQWLHFVDFYQCFDAFFIFPHIIFILCCHPCHLPSYPPFPINPMVRIIQFFLVMWIIIPIVILTFFHCWSSLFVDIPQTKKLHVNPFFYQGCSDSRCMTNSCLILGCHFRILTWQPYSKSSTIFTFIHEYVIDSLSSILLFSCPTYLVFALFFQFSIRPVLALLFIAYGS